MLNSSESTFGGYDMQKPRLDTKTLTLEQSVALEQYKLSLTSAKQLIELRKLTDTVQGFLSEYDNETTSKEIEKLGVVLLDVREALQDIKKREDPEQKDFSKPVVDAINKLEKAVNIEVKPQVNVSSPDVKVPPVDLKKIEKILKTDMPKAFEKAIKLVPKTPKTDFEPLLDAWEGISEQLQSIDTATRMKPQPGSMKVTNRDGTNIGGGTNPTPSGAAAQALTNDTSAAYEASSVSKAGAGTVYGLTGYNSRTSDQFFQFFNSTTVPADATAPVITIRVAASSNFSVDFGVYGRRFSTGISWSNSSTGPTKTIGSADMFVDINYV